MSPDLPALASILADWLEPAPKVPGVYLFGSRVRGDHRPDSDIDVRLFLNEWRNVDAPDMEWWTRENETDFAALKARLPGPLAMPILVAGRDLEALRFLSRGQFCNLTRDVFSTLLLAS